MAAPDIWDPPTESEWQWYQIFRVAQWAGIPAWDLARQPVAFFEGYKAAMEIEAMTRASLARNNA